MQALHRGDLSAALAIIDERHAEQTRKRLQMEQTLSALRLFVAGPASQLRTSHPQQLRVGDAAKQVGVRVSALHFWEQQGLLHPVREQHSHYRLYDEHQMRRLRVVALLRDAGYPSTSSSRCSTNWRRVGLKKPSWLWRKGVRNSRGQAGHALKP